MRFASVVLTSVLLCLLGISILKSEAHTPLPDEMVLRHEQGLQMAPGFSWVESGWLAAMARPGLTNPLEQDLAFLESVGITMLVTLTEEPIPENALAKFGIEGLHLPVKDFTPPSIAQINRFLKEIERIKLTGRGLAIHCTAGIGRTGTMLAAYLVTQGLGPDESISEIRRLRPGSIETPEQEARVVEFAHIHAQQIGQE